MSSDNGATVENDNGAKKVPRGVRLDYSGILPINKNHLVSSAHHSKQHEQKMLILCTHLVPIFEAFCLQFPSEASLNLSSLPSPHNPQSNSHSVKGEALLSMARFETFFQQHKLEYLHYTGPISFDQPFFLYHAEDLFCVAMGYLVLYLSYTTSTENSSVVRPQLRPFAILLLLFWYATQPSFDGPLSPPTTNHAGGDSTETPHNENRNEEMPPRERTRIMYPRRQIEIGEYTLNELLSRVCFATSGNTHAESGYYLSFVESQALFTLIKHDAFRVQMCESYTTGRCTFHLLRLHEAAAVDLLVFQNRPKVHKEREG
ncbi:hypothetical protein AGDE_16666 [Angomonas deanei]|nr:hypothetical protein AGDE_16666 [Angomonas deanei]|eukprot:EPY16661.1 hypothetical protein AGDE_16666 [Angomonas deanei]